MMEAKFEGLPTLKKADLSKYQAALEAGRKYLTASSKEELQQAAQEFHVAYTNQIKNKETIS